MQPRWNEYWPLARRKPCARRAKSDNADQLARVAASMAQFGWTVPCLVATDAELIAGHSRPPAAAHPGLSEVLVIVPGH